VKDSTGLVEMEDKTLSVAAIAKSCQDTISQQSMRGSPHHQQWLRGRLIDFNLWAAGIGVFADGYNALDERLAPFPEFCEAVKIMLRTLQHEFARIDQPAEDALVQATMEDNECGEDMSDDLRIPHRYFSLDNDESDASSEVVMNEFRKSQSPGSFEDLEETFNQLIELGVVIRQAGRASHLRKADANFDGTNYQEFEQYMKIYIYRRSSHRSFDHDHYKQLEQSAAHVCVACHSMPAADGPLGHVSLAVAQTLSLEQEHLVKINLRRRHRFLWAGNRGAALARSHSHLNNVGDDDENAQPANDQVRSTMLQHNKDLDAISFENQKPDTSTLVATVLRGRVHPIPEVQPGVAPSGRLTSVTAKLQYPLPPNIDNAQTFSCPCCRSSLPKSMTASDEWR
jgi:hypothetical protein